MSYYIVWYYYNITLFVILLFYYFNVVLCLVMSVCNDILAITMFCLLLCCFVQLQYCFCFLIFFYLVLVILQCYNIPILLFLVQFCIVSCYIVGSCFILFCFVFSNVTLLFFNVTTSFFVLVSRFVMLYHCFFLLKCCFVCYFIVLYWYNFVL